VNRKRLPFLPLRQVLADQALEEGRHDVALRLYRASLAAPVSSYPAPAGGSGAPPSPAPAPACDQERADGLSPAAAATVAAAGQAKRKAALNAGTENTKTENTKTERNAQGPAIASKPAAVAAAAEATVTGDALHGVGVALLAAGRFRKACRAWERCVIVRGPGLGQARVWATEEEEGESFGGVGGKVKGVRLR